MGPRWHNPNRCQPRRGEVIRLSRLDGYYTVAAAAARLGLTHACVDHWLKWGYVEFARMGNERLVRLEDIARRAGMTIVDDVSV